MRNVPRFVGGFEIAVGGGDDAHVHFDSLVAAHRTHFFFLQHAQQLGLHFQRQFADFVQENRTGIGRLKKSLLRFQRSGEGAFFVAEEFAFNQRRNQRAAIDGDKRTVGKCAAEMNGAGDQLFSGSALAGDEHRRCACLSSREATRSTS